MGRRFLLDNDGSSFMFKLTQNLELDIAEMVAECPDNVTTYLVCPGGSRFWYPTKAAAIWPGDRAPLSSWFQQGIDPYGMFLKALRESGKETFITLRMNDVHDPDDPNHRNVPAFRLEHPEMIVDPDAVGRGTSDWKCWALDYTWPEVRAYKLSIIRELVELYDVDGLQLDWMRFPRHLSGTPGEVWAKRSLLTEFTAGVRHIIRGSGKDMKLAARVPPSVAGCRYVGLDIGAWVHHGLVDFITACSFLVTDFAMPLRAMREEMNSESVPLYAGFDLPHATQYHSPESLRGAAAGLYGCGADGIYVFNFPCWEYYVVQPPYHWLDGLDDPESAAHKPLLFSVGHQRNRIPHVDLPPHVPVSLAPEEEVTLSMTLPTTALPAERARVLIHTAGDVDLTVNGHQAEDLVEHRRMEIFIEYTAGSGEPLPEYRPPKGDTRVFRFPSSCLRAGENTFTIKNTTQNELLIQRLNLEP